MSLDRNEKAPLPWKALFLSASIGFVFLLVNFPKFTTQVIVNTIKHPTWQTTALFPVVTVQDILTSLIGPVPEMTFQKLMSINFIGFFVYLVAVSLFALRHKDVGLLGFSIGGLILGYAALHLISWMAVIIVAILTFVVNVLGWLAYIIKIVLEFIFVRGWWLILLLVLAGVIYAFKDKLLKFLAGSVVATIVGYLLYRFVPIVWRWFLKLIDPIIRFLKMVWSKYIVPVLAFVITILGWLIFVTISVLGIFLILTTLGRLVVDQFRAAWHSGKGRKELALSGFAVGSAIALIVLTSVAAPPVASGINDGWKHSFEIIDGFIGTNIGASALARIEPTNIFVATMPNSVKTFVFTYLTNAHPPIVDSALFFAIIIIAATSVALRVFPSISKVPTKTRVSFLPTEYFAIFGGLLIAVVIIFAQAVSEGDS